MFVVCLGFAGGSADLPAMVDLGSTPGLGRSSGEGNGFPLQYSGLENSMDYRQSPWGGKELNTTERLSLTFIPQWICQIW